MRCAEGLPSIDLDCEQTARHSRSIVTAMHEKAPGCDRPAFALRQRHPIFVSDLLDAQWPELRAVGYVLDQHKQGVARRCLGKMGEDLELSFAQLEHANRDRRRLECFFERMRDPFSRRFIRRDVRLIEARLCLLGFTVFHGREV
jgi:hypothetical protein